MTVEIVEVKGLEELDLYIKGLPRGMLKEAKTEYSRAAFNVHKEVSDRIRFGPLHSRTGNLLRSLTPEVHGSNLKNLGSSVSSTASYAPIQERGGEINAKRAYRRVEGGPYLNIPTSANKTAAGVMKLSARDVFTAGGYIRPINARKAKFGVFLNGRLMFALVKQVTIPPRLGMQQAADDEIPSLIKRLGVAMDEAIK